MFDFKQKVTQDIECHVKPQITGTNEKEEDTEADELRGEG